MDVKSKVLLQLFHKSKLRNGTKTFLAPKFSLFIAKLKKLGFSAPLIPFWVHEWEVPVSAVLRQGPHFKVAAVPRCWQRVGDLLGSGF